MFAVMLMACGGTAVIAQQIASRKPVSAKAATEKATNPMSDGRTGLGKGIFVTTRGNKMAVPDEVKNNPYVSGVQAGISWAELEPAKGKYAWNEIESFLAELDKYGKKGAFKFVSAGGKVMSDSQLARGKGKSGTDVVYENTGTPKWLWDDTDVKFLGNIATAKGRLPYYPVYWDPAYQKHLEEFIAAFAKRFDGDRRIEYIRMGGWQIGTNEPSFYGGASEFIVEQLAKHGMDIGRFKDKSKLTRSLPGDGLYAKSVRDMIDIWYKHFKKTRLGATIHFSKEEGSFEEAMMRHCFNKKTAILNTGLNEKDKNLARKEFREAHDQYGCKVGWGGITHIGQFSNKEELGRKGRTLRFEAILQGIGNDDEPNYAPASKVSYLVFGTDFLEDEEAVKWASGHLSQ
jgi:hypothetical protein